jgi:Glycosyl hydrolases family 16
MGHTRASGNAGWRICISYVAFLTFASCAVAAPGVARASARSVEVEHMLAPSHGTRVYRDSTASGGRAVVFTRRVALRWRTSPVGATRVGVWASGVDCRGVVRVALSIDGRRVLDSPVHSGGWKEYSVPLQLRTRRHRIKLYFPDPRRTRSCERRLRVDRLVFSNAREGSTINWHPVFDDEFDGGALDLFKWNPFNWNARTGFFDPSNAVVEGGLLRLRASAPNRSAMVQTLGKFAMRYGRIEASIRVPSGQGLWPSFWLKTAQVASAKYPEIDVLEMWMTDRPDDLNDPFTVSQNYHWTTPSGDVESSHSWVRGSTDYSAGFHRFALQWDPRSIRWFIDGVETKEVDGPMVPTAPMFIAFSLQIGHAWWLGSNFAPNANTPFPSYMDVDWVRVYQR